MNLRFHTLHYSLFPEVLVREADVEKHQKVKQLKTLCEFSLFSVDFSLYTLANLPSQMFFKDTI
jgi:hypothetical protein